jgi:hypothetical protein
MSGSGTVSSMAVRTARFIDCRSTRQDASTRQSTRCGSPARSADVRYFSFYPADAEFLPRTQPRKHILLTFTNTERLQAYPHTRPSTSCVPSTMTRKTTTETSSRRCSGCQG